MSNRPRINVIHIVWQAGRVSVKLPLETPGKMIRPLRQRHRQLIAIIGVLLPVAFGVGIAGRKPIPQTQNLPEEVFTHGPASSATLVRPLDIFASSPVDVELVQLETPPGSLAVRIRSHPTFLKPDLIVYWVAGTPEADDELPSQAILLGAFHSDLLRLPEQVRREEGQLILYSLADHHVVETSRPFRGEGSLDATE